MPSVVGWVFIIVLFIIISVVLWHGVREEG